MITGLGDCVFTHTGTVTITKAIARDIYWNKYPSDVTYDGYPLETPDVDFRIPGLSDKSPSRILWRDDNAASNAPWKEGMPTDAGSYMLRAELDGTDNYSGAWTERSVTIRPAMLTVNVTAAEREYNGETTVELTASLVGVEGNDNVALPNEGKYTGTVESADAGEDKAVTLPTFTIEGDDVGNYTLTQPTGLTVNITKASATAENSELTITNNMAKTYTVELAALLPDLETGKSYGTVTYTMSGHNLGAYYNDGAEIKDGILSLPILGVNSSEEGTLGSITISFSSDNYTISNATITVKRINKTLASITGVTAASGLTYTGNAQTGYTGTPAVRGYTGSFDVTYTGTGNTTYGPSTTAPTNAGTYSVKIAIPEASNTFMGETTLSFTIAKAAMTITAEDKTAVVGDAKPAFTYTVTGLKGDDKLTTVPTLTCNADMNTAGDYAINISGAVAGDNYVITYVPGTLTVKQEYKVTVADTTNGTVAVSATKAVEGTQIIIIATPKNNWYKLKTLVVTNAAGTSITVTNAGDGKYAFTMPESDVKVTATFGAKVTSIADSTNPQTGDDFQLVMWSSIMCVSSICLLAAFVDQKRKRTK